MRLRGKENLATADTEKQKEDKVAGYGGEADGVEATLLDAPALLDGGGEGVDDYLDWDLEELAEAVDAACKTVEILVYSRVDEPHMSQDYEDDQHEYRAQQRHCSPPLFDPENRSHGSLMAATVYYFVYFPRFGNLYRTP